MSLNLIYVRSLAVSIPLMLGLLAGNTAAGATLALQGQSKGDPTWIAGNLLNWQELDFIPCRVYITGGPASNQSVTISFPHLSGTTPGVQDLFNFAASPNAVITSGPTLTVAASGVWSYTFSVSVNNGNPAFVQFSARLAAGAHLNTGSSLMLGGNPTSMGNLQIHKPAPGPGAPNLGIVKSGPATTAPGATITYTLSYTNHATGTNTAYGSQISDILPDGLTVNSNGVPGGDIVGNTIFWDLGNLPPGAHGQVSFQAQVSASAANGQVLTNFSQIKSSEIDGSYADNISTFQTTVIISCTRPTVTQNPISQTSCPGTPISFSVAASGTGPFNYQWRHGGNNISAATNSTYSIGAVSAGDAGLYDVVVSNGCGSTNSGAATLSINTTVSATPLVSQTVCPGTTVVFSTVASGSGPFNYSWLKDGSPVGQNTNVLTLNNATSANAGLYSVIVSGACGSVTNSATLAVNTTVSATPLVSQTVCPGTTVVFSTVASGSGPFNYSWLKDGSPLGQNTNNLTLNTVTSANAGLYSVIVSGACGSVTNSATLAVNTTVNATPLVSQTVCPGSTVVFSTVASGSGPFNYAWLKDGSPIGQNTNVLTLNTVTSANAGLYSVIVSGACGSVTNSATLAVNSTVSATPLVSQTVCPGTTVLFSTVASGSGPFNYTWLKDGSPLGQNTNNLTLNTVTSANAGLYSVIVSGACGSVTNSATLAVNTTVSATPLVSQTVCPGTTVVFSTVASGTGPFNYAWLKDGSPVGQNTNNLTLNNVASANAGLYSVIVSGACGSVTNSATLAVNTTVSATPLVSQTVCPGTTVVFSTVASGSGPFNYAWLKDGSPLGQNTNVLTLNSVTSANAGIYSVIVSGACGSVTNSATLAVNTTVSATPLVSQTVCPGTTVVFSTVASGSGPFNYAWLKDGSPVGQNTNVLTLNNATSANAGVYSVIVSGACGSVTNSATLAVNTTVSATPLVSQTVCPGTTVVFSTVASGSGPFNYAWFKDGSPVGQNTNNLTLNTVTSANAGVYSVIVSGACGSVTNSATLAVNTTVSATPLVSQTVCPGTTVVFSTVASGSGPFNYSWLKDGSPLGQNTNNLTLNTVTSANAGLYSVIVSGACGSVTNSATLAVNTTVNATPLVSQTVCPGSTVVFSTVASGSGPFNYAWLKDGSPIGQNTNVLTLNTVTSANAGLYSVIVSGACGSVTNSATLAVNATVSATPLVSQTVCPGTTVVFSTVASGSGPFNYAWLKDGSPIGQNTNVLTLNNVASANAGLYSVIVSGACGSVTNSATLAVNATVSATPLVSQTVCPGTTVLFSTVASGSGPFNYAWFKDGSPVGQNTNVLTLNNATSTNAGLYSVIVSGACGSVTNSATLAVNATVSATPLSSLVLNPGETAVFSTIASGTGPFVYVWKKNGSPINGRIGSSLVLSNVTLADEATYTVEVSGGCGSASQSASLHINQAPTVNIFNPTNGTLLLAPANLVVSANAQDIDGVVTNVQFFQGTNKVGETTNGNPFEISLTNLAGGTYVFTALATDNGGLSATSAPVTVTIMNELPLTVLTAVHFNPQTGLYEQSVRVTNPTLSMLAAIRVYVLGLTSSMHVYNPSGTTNGVPYVQSGSPVAPGGHADFVIEYYVTAPGVPNPTLVAQAVPADNGGGTAVSGAGVHINRGFRTVDGNFLVEFATETNRIYYVQYSSDLKTWKTVPTAVTGNGTWIQWVDNGQPKTESAPSSTVTRFYRVVVVSQ